MRVWTELPARETRRRNALRRCWSGSGPRRFDGYEGRAPAFNEGDYRNEPAGASTWNRGSRRPYEVSANGPMRAERYSAAARRWKPCSRCRPQMPVTGNPGSNRYQLASGVASFKPTKEIKNLLPKTYFLSWPPRVVTCCECLSGCVLHVISDVQFVQDMCGTKPNFHCRSWSCSGMRGGRLLPAAPLSYTLPSSYWDIGIGGFLSWPLGWGRVTAKFVRISIGRDALLGNNTWLGYETGRASLGKGIHGNNGGVKGIWRAWLGD